MIFEKKNYKEVSENLDKKILKKKINFERRRNL